jgi:hypothetical protein
MTALAVLVAELLAMASVMSGYPAAPPPEVTILPAAEIAAVGCRSQCSARGAYDARLGILLSDELDPVRDVRSRATLLHEIIHYLQDVHGGFAGLPPCERFLARERQAYAIQNRYLQRWGQPPDQGYAFLLQTIDLNACARS